MCNIHLAKTSVCPTVAENSRQYATKYLFSFLTFVRLHACACFLSYFAFAHIPFRCVDFLLGRSICSRNTHTHAVNHAIFPELFVCVCACVSQYCASAKTVDSLALMTPGRWSWSQKTNVALACLAGQQGRIALAHIHANIVALETGDAESVRVSVPYKCFL